MNSWKYIEKSDGATSRLVGSQATGLLRATLVGIRGLHPTWKFVDVNMGAVFIDPESHRTIAVASINDGPAGITVEDST